MANRSPRIKTYNYAEGIDIKIEILQNMNCLESLSKHKRLGISHDTQPLHY